MNKPAKKRPVGRPPMVPLRPEVLVRGFWLQQRFEFILPITGRYPDWTNTRGLGTRIRSEYRA